MTLLTAGELASIRTAQALTFSDTLTHQRKANASNARGGRTDTLTTVASDVPCRFVVAGGSSGTANLPSEVAERIKTKPAWMLAVAVGYDMRVNDVVTVNGKTLQVLFVDAHSHQAALRFWAVEP